MKSKIMITLCFLIICISANSQESYYNALNLHVTGITLKKELSKKVVETHTQFLFYEQIWNAAKATDLNPENNQEVVLLYGYEDGSDTDNKNDRTRNINDNGGNSGQWNREHMYSQSLGTPPLSDTGPGADAHHLNQQIVKEIHLEAIESLPMDPAILAFKIMEVGTLEMNGKVTWLG